MSEEFTITWEVEDGYVNNGPQYAYIDKYELHKDMSEADIEDFLLETVQEAFTSDITYSINEHSYNEFMKWAREKVAELKEEE